VIYSNSFAHEKTPRNTGFHGVFLSDADGTRTRNLRIDSPSDENDSANENEAQENVGESCLRSGLRPVCDSELQAWLDRCPVELSNMQKKRIANALKANV
jgi:ABC-type glutathione transport system ATPase component